MLFVIGSSIFKSLIQVKQSKFCEFLCGNWNKMMMAEQEKPNYEQSGRLVDDVPGEYMYPGDLKHYSTPPDAATPLVVWALYPVRGFEMHPERGKSTYYIGRSCKCDVQVAHPSCSVDHAVIQFRNKVGVGSRPLPLPFIVDLGSENGTYLNGERIGPKKFVELRDHDMLKFGSIEKKFRIICRSWYRRIGDDTGEEIEKEKQPSSGCFYFKFEHSGDISKP